MKTEQTPHTLQAFAASMLNLMYGRGLRRAQIKDLGLSFRTMRGIADHFRSKVTIEARKRLSTGDLAGVIGLVYRPQGYKSWAALLAQLQHIEDTLIRWSEPAQPDQEKALSMVEVDDLVNSVERPRPHICLETPTADPVKEALITNIGPLVIIKANKTQRAAISDHLLDLLGRPQEVEDLLIYQRRRPLARDWLEDQIGGKIGFDRIWIS